MCVGDIILDPGSGTLKPIRLENNTARKVEIWHLTKTDEHNCSNTGHSSKVISEIFLTRLLSTKVHGWVLFYYSFTYLLCNDNTVDYRQVFRLLLIQNLASFGLQLFVTMIWAAAFWSRRLSFFIIVYCIYAASFHGKWTCFSHVSFEHCGDSHDFVWMSHKRYHCTARNKHWCIHHRIVLKTENRLTFEVYVDCFPLFNSQISCLFTGDATTVHWWLIRIHSSHGRRFNTALCKILIWFVWRGRQTAWHHWSWSSSCLENQQVTTILCHCVVQVFLSQITSFGFCVLCV